MYLKMCIFAVVVIIFIAYFRDVLNIFKNLRDLRGNFYMNVSHLKYINI